MNTLQAYESLSPVAEYNKAELAVLAEKQAEEIILAGSAEKSWAALSKFEYLIKQLKERIENDAIAEIDKGNDTGFGVKMKVIEKRTFGYKNNAEWVALDKESKSLETFIKSLSEPMTKVIEGTGEVVRYEPPTVTTSSYIKTEF